MTTYYRNRFLPERQNSISFMSDNFWRQYGPIKRRFGTCGYGSSVNRPQTTVTTVCGFHAATLLVCVACATAVIRRWVVTPTVSPGNDFQFSLGQFTWHFAHQNAICLILGLGIFHAMTPSVVLHN